jgi:hypothetical protein
MSEDIYEGRCRDCFDKFPKMEILNDARLADPFVPGMCLCRLCLGGRVADYVQSEPIRPIGIPPTITTASWVDLEPIIVEFDRGKIKMTVDVRFRMPNIPSPTIEDGGEVRMRLGENLYWDAGEHLGGRGGTLESLRPLIMSGARFMLHYRFQPIGKVIGLAG